MAEGERGGEVRRSDKQIGIRVTPADYARLVEIASVYGSGSMTVTRLCELYVKQRLESDKRGVVK